jgi:hypothetical protein
MSSFIASTYPCDQFTFDVTSLAPLLNNKIKDSIFEILEFKTSIYKLFKSSKQSIGIFLFIPIQIDTHIMTSS